MATRGMVEYLRDQMQCHSTVAAFRSHSVCFTAEYEDSRCSSIRKISIYSFTCLLFEKIEGFFVLHSS